MDGGDNFGAGGGEVGVAFGGFVKEDEGSLVTYAEAMEEFTFEAGFLDEPAGVDFDAIVTAINWVTFGFGELGLFLG